MKEWRDWKSLRAYTDSHLVPRFLCGITSHPPWCLSKAQDQRITFSFLFRVKWGVLCQLPAWARTGISLSEKLSTNPPDFSFYPCLNFQMTWYLQFWNFFEFCSGNWLIGLWHPSLNILRFKLSLFFQLLAKFQKFANIFYHVTLSFFLCHCGLILLFFLSYHYTGILAECQYMHMFHLYYLMNRWFLYLHLIYICVTTTAAAAATTISRTIRITKGFGSNFISK